jgi:hypothetical protein
MQLKYFDYSVTTYLEFRDFINVDEEGRFLSVNPPNLDEWERVKFDEESYRCPYCLESIGIGRDEHGYFLLNSPYHDRIKMIKALDHDTGEIW